MSKIHIRQATPEDAERIARWNEAMALETEKRRLDPAIIRAGVAAVLHDPSRGVYHLASIDHAVAGQLLVTFEWSDWRCRWFWWIQSVYVAPEHRGAGVYRALHEHVVEQARSAGEVGGIRLYVDADNAAAQHVYERVGMVRTHYQLFETDWSNVESRGGA